jgi:heme-degrading monooxygenase HmoA
MYSAAFIFEPGSYDVRFHALDAQIESAARANPGYLGRENWQSDDGTRFNATYYWTDLESLKIFSQNPQHLEAKRDYQRWYKGFHIVISQVIRSYGDGTLQHPTPNHRSTPSEGTRP